MTPLYGPRGIERAWEGMTAVVIGGGPSLSLKQVRHVAKARLHDRCRVIAVNDACFLSWGWADWLHACDAKWWLWHPEAALFPGTKTTMEKEELTKASAGFEEVLPIRNAGIEGFEEDPSAVKNGRNGGYQALHLAAHAGASRVILLGIDMKAAPGKQQWFGMHPNLVGVDYETAMLPYWNSIVEPLKLRGISVLNCSPASALKCFPEAEVEAALPL